VHGSLVFPGVDVHLCPGKVGQASVVVDVQVGEHDVAHVRRSVAQGSELQQGRMVRVAGGMFHPEQELHPPGRLLIIGGQPGIDQTSRRPSTSKQCVTCLTPGRKGMQLR
jgi:hypothetical protein